MNEKTKINIFVDGGSRGNPGQSAVGVYIVNEEDEEICGFGERIGIATNNVAEYKAIIAALSWICEHRERLRGDMQINMHMDSLLIYSQIVGLYKVKNPQLRKLLYGVREKESAINIPINYFHVPREKNREADSLVNLALDNKI